MENQMRRIGTIGRNYEVTTASGTYRVENTPGGSRGRNWLIFKPGQSVAVSSQPTKSEALLFIDQDSKAAQENIMEARIDHVTDARDTRPTYSITYREWSSTTADHLVIQADNINHAMRALTKHVGNQYYSVTDATLLPRVAPVSWIDGAADHYAGLVERARNV